MAAGATLVRLESNERVDLNDLLYALQTSIDEAQRAASKAVFTGMTKTWIVSGFDVITLTSAIQINGGSAVLNSRDENGVNDSLPVSFDTTRVVDVSTFPDGTYGVFIRASYQDTQQQNRVFWNAVAGAEYGRLVFSRRIPYWDARVEVTKPSPEYTQIATITVAGGVVGVITKQRQMMFEGDEGNAFASVWGNGANDRNADRSTYGVRDLGTQLDAFRAQFAKLFGTWYGNSLRNLSVGSTSTSPAVTGSNANAGGFGLQGVVTGTTGTAVMGIATGGGTGITGSSVSGLGAQFSGNATRGALLMSPVGSDPTSPIAGEAWFNGTPRFYDGVSARRTPGYLFYQVSSTASSAIGSGSTTQPFSNASFQLPGSLTFRTLPVGTQVIIDAFFSGTSTTNGQSLQIGLRLMGPAGTPNNNNGSYAYLTTVASGGGIIYWSVRWILTHRGSGVYSTTAYTTAYTSAGVGSAQVPIATFSGTALAPTGADWTSSSDTNYIGIFPGITPFPFAVTCQMASLTVI